MCWLVRELCVYFYALSMKYDELRERINERQFHSSFSCAFCSSNDHDSLASNMTISIFTFNRTTTHLYSVSCMHHSVGLFWFCVKFIGNNKSNNSIALPHISGHSIGLNLNKFDFEISHTKDKTRQCYATWYAHQNVIPLCAQLVRPRSRIHYCRSGTNWFKRSQLMPIDLGKRRLAATAKIKNYVLNGLTLRHSIYFHHHIQFHDRPIVTNGSSG